MSWSEALGRLDPGELDKDRPITEAHKPVAKPDSSLGVGTGAVSRGVSDPGHVAQELRVQPLAADEAPPLLQLHQRPRQPDQSDALLAEQEVVQLHVAEVGEPGSLQ